MRSRLVAISLAAAACAASLSEARADCSQTDRNVVYAGKPAPVYLAKNVWSTVIFPENLQSILPEKPQGLVYQESVFHDRLFFTVTDPLYFGNVILEGVDGKTYELNILGRDGCADHTVTLMDQAAAAVAPPPPAPANGRQKTLLEYMIAGTPPPDYTVEEVPGPPEKRLVYSQGLGTVNFYIDKIYHGYNYTGFVLLAVNQGRTPVRVNIEGIDFGSSELRKTFGRVKQITMEPWDFRLGPAPEYSSDAAHPTNQGIVYIVTYNRSNLGGE